ncbi:MAG: hypothetical protein H7A39_01475 [Chlamydiales bacterium]|nr:hypothetical protein [Chlamydiales bacterium]
MSGIPSKIPTSASEQTLAWLDLHIAALQRQIAAKEGTDTTPYAPRDAKKTIDRIGLVILTPPTDGGSARLPVRRDLNGEFEAVEANAPKEGFGVGDLDAAMQALKKLNMDEKGRRIEELLND